MTTHTRIFALLDRRISCQIFSHVGTRPYVCRTVTKYPGLGNVRYLKMTNSAGLSICYTAFIETTLFAVRQQVLAFAECKPQRRSIFLIKFSAQHACKCRNVTEALSYPRTTSVIHILIPSSTFHIRQTINLTL